MGMRENVDRLHEVREQIRALQAVEAGLTETLKEFLERKGLTGYPGTKAIATLDQRVDIEIPVQVWIDEVGADGMPALSVSITRAREIVSGRTIERIGIKQAPALVLRTKAMPIVASDARLRALAR